MQQGRTSILSQAEQDCITVCADGEVVEATAVQYNLQGGLHSQAQQDNKT